MIDWKGLIPGDGAFLYNYIIIPALIVLISMILLRGSRLLIERLTKTGSGRIDDPLQNRRRETIRGLLQNLVKYAIYFVMTVTILNCYHVPVMAILSTVGVLGVALAFGAQSLCKDVITGFFILLEDQFFIGEYIEAQGVAGFVEQFTMRCTHLRDFDGRLHIIPNGSMGLVTNHHRGSRRVLVEMGIPYEKDIGQGLTVLQKACDEVNQQYTSVIKEKIKALGIVDLTSSGATIRMQGQAETIKHWEVERALRKQALEALIEAGFDIPYPHSRVILDQEESATK